MPRYLSPEWFAAANVAAATRQLDGVDLVLGQVITGAPGGDVRYHVRVEGGHIALTLDSEPESEAADQNQADATFTEDYPTAVAMFRGELSPQDALSQGRVRVAGNMATVTAHHEALAELGSVFDDVRAADHVLRGTGSTMAHAPGWYADPAEPDRLAYWDGQRWTGDYRPRPTWTERSPGAGSKRRPPIPGHDRRQWFLIVAALVVVVGLAFIALPHRGSDGPKVLTDRDFVSRANDRCAATMNGLRPPLVGDSSKRPSNVELAEQVDRAAEGLAGLAQDLRGLTVAAADQPHIQRWLADWDRYAEVGHRVANTLRSDKPNNAIKVGREGDDFQKRADRFARANGVARCQFFIVPPSTGRDPFSGG